ncbi:FtsX-like permease family protein [Butyrivibrio sp. JL13D10]|uniref:FtsX-like permease family protein n=1 Tax=Butyrivibrio sp. JL13D10 TaxID=3236815 RepID=UPI0038B479DB
MKESWAKDALRNIKKRIISWLSIVTIVVISAGIILGICFPMYSLKQIGDEYFKEHNFKDADIASGIGIKAKDVDIVKANETVKDAEGVLNLPGKASHNEKSCSLKVISLTEKISVPYVKSGSLPVKKNECAISPEVSDYLGVFVGDTINLELTGARFEEALWEKRYTVTGIAEHPDYFGTNRDGFCILPYSSFDTDDLAFDYTNIFVDGDIPDNFNTMQKEYFDSADIVKKELNNDVEVLSVSRKKEFDKELDDEYLKAEKKVNDELADGKKKLDDATNEFNEKIGDAKKQLEDGEKELAEAKEKAQKELADGERKIREGEDEYNTKIADGEKQLADAKKQLEDELNDAKYKLFSGFLELDNAEKTLNEKEKEYEEGVKKLEAGREELNKGWDEYDSGIYRMETYLSDSNLDAAISSLELASQIAGDSTIPPEIINELRAAKGYSIIKRFGKVIEIIDKLPDEMKEQMLKSMNLGEGETDLKGMYEQLKGAEDKLTEGEEQLRSGADELAEGRRLLDQGWFSLEQGKKELAEGQAELEKKEPEARQLLADKEKEFEEKKKEGAEEIAKAKRTFKAEKEKALKKLSDAEEELSEGKTEFEEEKKKGEDELRKARTEYEDGKREAYDKLTDVKKEIEEAKNSDGEWLVQMREANLNFIELKSNVDVLTKFMFVFMPIFGGITVIVCFFTIAIIVEEQKKQIGVLKAFGAHKSEIRKKYIIFGVSAAAFGAVLGVVGGLALEALILNTMRDMFIFDELKHTANPVPVIATFVIVVFLTTLVVIWSCEKFISCSATGLLSGNEPRNKGRSKAAKRESNSIYVKMIISNFYTDMGRVIITVVIVLSCCMLIGLGITLKKAFDKSLNKQINELWSYDIKVVLKQDVTNEERDEVLRKIRKYKYYPVYKLGAVLKTDNKESLTEVYLVDDETMIKEFLNIITRDGKDLTLPEEGIIVTEEMAEKDGLIVGTSINMVTDELQIEKVEVKGNFLQYFGKCAFMSRDYYEKIFDQDTEDNCYFIKAGEDTEALYESLSGLAVVDDVSKADSIKEKNKTMLDLFDIVVYLVLAFSFILSFMILLNLSNILVLRRMRELLTMRVNGFSNSQVIGFLAGEVVVTTTTGVLLGIAIGIPISMLSVKMMQTNGFSYVLDVFPIAWVVAAFSCFAFAGIINSIAFRKIGLVPLTDITKY